MNFSILLPNSFIPLILQLLLYIIFFSDVTDPDIISGNLTVIISDHLPQF